MTAATIDADELASDLANILADLELEDRDEVDEAALDFLREFSIGFFKVPRRVLNGRPFVDVLEFTLSDGSAIVLAEAAHGGIAIFTSRGSPSHHLH